MTDAVAWSDDRSVTTVTRGRGSVTVLMAHGAGTDQHHPMVVRIAEEIAERGLRVVTFDYPYSEEGRRRPDRAETLLRCHRAVLESILDRYGRPVVLAGRSMGGRMGTMLAAEGAPVAAVVAYAYPLHPAGKPDRLRIEHLPAIEVPMLMFRGTRDVLSRADLFDTHVRSSPTATIVDMEGADHSFRGRGWDPSILYPFLADRTVDWLRIAVEV